MKTTKTAIVLALAALIAGGAMAQGAQAGGRTPTTPAGDIRPAPTRPGGDPPAPEPKGPEALRQPWAPPSGPGDLRDTPNEGIDPGPKDKTKGPTSPFAHYGIVSDGCIGGKMVDRSTTGEWLPSDGWRVHLWVYGDYHGGQIINDVITPLDEHGEWQYCNRLAKVDDSKPYLYTYESINPLLRINDTRGGSDSTKPYWTGPVLMNNPPSAHIYPDGGFLPASMTSDGEVLVTHTLDTGPIGTDSEPNELYALGDIMRWGMKLLRKLDASGLKASRSATIDNVATSVPHEIHYPANFAACNGIAWACYEQFGDNVYIDSEDTHVDEYTVQHELAHSVVDEYWNGITGGGAHFEDTCAAKAEVAYSEGIANFIAAWAHNDDPYVYDGNYVDHFNPELPSPTECLSNDNDPGRGVHSEAYVAGALWDLYDHGPDAEYAGDLWGSAKSWGIVQLVLTHQVKDAAQLFRDHRAAHPDFQQYIDDVFHHNYITTKVPEF